MSHTLRSPLLGAAVLVGAVLAAAGCASLSRSGPDFRGALAEARESPQNRAAFVDLVVVHARQANALRLFQAADYAAELGRIEDSAFLYYAGQMRKRLDLYTSEAEPRGVSQTLNMLDTSLGPAVNPVIVRDPEAYEAVIRRLDAWRLLAPENYDPGWAYSDRRAREKQRARALRIKERELEAMRRIAELLNDPEYLQALLTVQAYHLAPRDSRSNVKLRAAKIEAERTMQRIESELGFDVSVPGGRRRRSR